MYLFGTGKKHKSWNSTNFMMTIFQEISKENSKGKIVWWYSMLCCKVFWTSKGIQKA